MYHHISDFLTDWEYESQTTLSLFRHLTNDSLEKEIHPNVRTLGFLSWHIIHTMQEMLGKAGLVIAIKEQQDYSGEKISEICEAYEKGAKLVAEAVKNSWKDSDLTIEDEMYGDKWKRGTTLSILIRHQAHHRAEMVVVMRLLGLNVVGAYGPKKEDWAQWGMEAMK
jgi:uncharacterized damage-inducible protein DinB